MNPGRGLCGCLAEKTETKVHRPSGRYSLSRWRYSETIPNAEIDAPPAESGGKPSTPWYRHWWAITLGVLLVLITLGTLLGGDTDHTTSATDDSTDAEPPAPQATLEPVPQEVEQEPPSIGEEARDGDFTFVVTAADDGPAIIGDADIGIEPEGRFVLVTVTVTNHGDAPGSILGDNQYLIDAEGRRAGADSEATVHLDQARSLDAEINPGDSVTGILVFDIPVDAVPAGVELHGSASSDGVTVALG